MKKFICLLVLCISLTFISQAVGAETEYIQLKNGLKVLLVEDHRFPLVSTRLFVHTGGAFEDPKYKGISHLLEHMVFNGTQNRPLGQLEKELYAAGGSYNAYTSTDNTTYLVTLPSEDWELSVDVVADMAFHPLLESKLLAKEKEVVKSEIDMYKDNQQRQLYSKLMALTLKNTPYEKELIGTAETLDNISVNTLKEYRAQHYDPQNMVLVMVGDITKKEVLPTIEKIFGGYTNTRTLEEPKQIDPVSLQYGIQVEVQEGPWQKAWLGFAMPAPSEEDPRFVPLDILGLLLGGTNNSFLTQELQFEQSLTDGFSMSNNTMERVGMLIGFAITDAQKLPKLWEELTKKLSTLSADSFTDDEIAQAKFLYTTMYQRSKERLDSIAESLGSNEIITPGTTEEDYLFAINQVDRKALQEAIDLWIDPQNMSIVVLAPQGSVEKGYIPDFEKDIVKYWPAKAENEKVKAEVLEDEYIKLSEGSQVVLLHDNVMPFFHVQLMFKGGDALLTPEEQGLSNALAYMLGTGTESKDRAEIEKSLLDKGAFVNMSAGREYFTIDISGPTQFQKEIFAIVEEILTKPTFTEKNWEKTKSDMIASIKASDDDPSSYLMRRVHPSLFKDNAYGYYSEGTIKNIESFALAQIPALWEEQKHQPWVLSAAGNFENQTILDFAKILPLSEKPYGALEAPAWTEEKKADYNLADRAQAHILQVFPTVPRIHEDTAALTVLSSLLGDMSGIMFTEFRVNQQLAYATSPITTSWPSVGYLAYYIGTDPKHIDKIEPSFNKISRDLQINLLDADRVEAAKNNLESKYIQGRQSLSRRAAEPAINIIYGRPADFEKEFMKEVQKVTPKDIQRVAQKYLNPEDAYIFRVLPMN